MPDKVLQAVGDEGKSITQFARDMRVSRQTIYQWAEDHPEFSDALGRAKEWSEAYWEDQMLDFMVSKEVNAPLIKLYMANRFKWTDKVEDSGESESDRLATALESLVDKLPGA